MGEHLKNDSMIDIGVETDELRSALTESGEMDDLPEDTPLDPSISYPSYKSFDEFVDLNRLWPRSEMCSFFATPVLTTGV